MVTVGVNRVRVRIIRASVRVIRDRVRRGLGQGTEADVRDDDFQGGAKCPGQMFYIRRHRHLAETIAIDLLPPLISAASPPIPSRPIQCAGTLGYLVLITRAGQNGEERTLTAV